MNEWMRWRFLHRSRIEQRIGRCHRYGQKHDVVVVNFVDRNNEADARVYQLLNEKFQLFEGVFGASDEVLGVIGSGVDFERRIAEIYRHCRQPEEIKEGFAALQQELSGEINQAMVKTRQTLLENFDEKVHEKLRVRDEESKTIRNKYERMLLDLTYSELKEHAVFDEQGFTLKSLPEKLSSFPIPIGRYELPRRSGDAHLYRITHPLAMHLLNQAKTHNCSSQKLIFDYSAYGKKVSTLEPYRGQRGHLILKLLTVEALGNREEHCLFVRINRVVYTFLFAWMPNFGHF